MLKFVNFHNERPTPNVTAKTNIDRPGLFDGYIHGMVEEGFLNIYKNPYVENLKIVLTEKGRVEADLFLQFFQLEEARDDPATKKSEIEDIKEAGKDAAEARFNFWRKKVQDDKIELTDDVKRKIVLAAKLLFDDDYVLLPDAHLGIRFNEQESEKYRQLSVHPKSNEI